MMKDYRLLTDEALFNLLKSDDEGALRVLYSRFWDRLLGVSMNRLNDLDIAKEVVQDIFLKLWERRHLIELTSSISTYLATATKYSVINQLDKQYRRMKHEEITDDYAVITVSSSDERLFEKELMALIEKSIQALPEKCQIVFRMSREDGFTHKQIAEELEISEKTVQAHITKAIKDIKKDLNILIPLLILSMINNQKF